jgi:hypothetical protein
MSSSQPFPLFAPVAWERLGLALASYERDVRAAAGVTAAPDWVELTALLRAGYVSQKDVLGFDGRRVILSLESDPPPGTTIARVFSADGSTELALLTDGSIQERSLEK